MLTGGLALSLAALVAAPVSATSTATAPLAIRASVVTGDGPDDPTAALALLDLVTRTSAYAEGVELVPPARLSAPEVDEPLRRCGSELTCTARVLRDAGAQLSLTVVLNLVRRPRLLSVRLVDCRSATTLAQEITELGPEPAEQDRVVADTVEAALLEAGRPLRARLAVDLLPAEATLEVLDAAARPADAKHVYWVSLPPDVPHLRVRLRARAPHYTDGAQEVDVVRGRDVGTTLALEAEGSALSSPWLWIGVAALAVGGGVAAGLLLGSSGDRRLNLCISPTGAGCP